MSGSTQLTFQHNNGIYSFGGGLINQDTNSLIQAKLNRTEEQIDQSSAHNFTSENTEVNV